MFGDDVVDSLPSCGVCPRSDDVHDPVVAPSERYRPPATGAVSGAIAGAWGRAIVRRLRTAIRRGTVVKQRRNDRTAAEHPDAGRAERFQIRAPVACGRLALTALGPLRRRAEDEPVGVVGVALAVAAAHRVCPSGRSVRPGPARRRSRVALARTATRTALTRLNRTARPLDVPANTPQPTATAPRDRPPRRRDRRWPHRVSRSR